MHPVLIGGLDKLVIENIKERILTRKNLEELARMVNEETDIETKSHRDELDLISESILGTNHRLERLYDAIETGKLGLGDLAVRIRELRNQQEKLQARKIVIEAQISDRKVELADMASLSSSIDDLHALLNEGTLIERKAFIRSFIKDVRVTGNEAVMNYIMPSISDNLAIEKEGVLSTVCYGGR
jgi:site-specific DNA recombinase